MGAYIPQGELPCNFFPRPVGNVSINVATCGPGSDRRCGGKFRTAMTCNTKRTAGWFTRWRSPAGKCFSGHWPRRCISGGRKIVVLLEGTPIEVRRFTKESRSGLLRLCLSGLPKVVMPSRSSMLRRTSFTNQPGSAIIAFDLEACCICKIVPFL